MDIYNLYYTRGMRQETWPAPAGIVRVSRLPCLSQPVPSGTAAASGEGQFLPSGARRVMWRGTSHRQEREKASMPSAQCQPDSSPAHGRWPSIRTMAGREGSWR